jgi:D-alanyl-D-alanine carboxypeptidase
VADISIPHVAGDIIFTPTEVAKFLSSLLTGKLISADSLTKMKELNQGFGRGLFQFLFYDKKAPAYNGGIDGFSSLAAYFEVDELAFVLTSNGMNYAMNDISITILSIYYGLPLDIPDFDQVAIELSERVLVKYEGVFSSQTMPLKIKIKVKDIKLTAQATGQGAFNLAPYSTSEFRFD